MTASDPLAAFAEGIGHGFMDSVDDADELIVSRRIVLALVAEVQAGREYRACQSADSQPCSRNEKRTADWWTTWVQTQMETDAALKDQS